LIPTPSRAAIAHAVSHNASMNAASLFTACVLIWGTTWYAIKFQLAGSEPAIGVAIRFTLAAGLLLAWCVARNIKLAVDWRTQAWLALLGVLGFSASYLLVYYAEVHIVSGLVAVGYSALPLVNMALARIFLGTPMSRRVALGGACGLVGIALIFWPEVERLDAGAPLLAGALLTAGAVLASGLSNMVVARNQALGIDGWGPLALAMGWGALASWAFVTLAGGSVTVEWTTAYVLSLAYLALFGSVLAFGAYYMLIARIGAARSAYVGVMATVLALLVSAVFESYDWRWATVFGIALAVAGNVLALQPASRSTPVKSPA
jgi:drug/metabolite transporter (DMT)-like permease